MQEYRKKQSNNVLMKVKEKDELKRVEDNVVTKFIREDVESYISDDSDVHDNVDIEQDKITGFRQNIFELIIHSIMQLSGTL